MAIRGQQLTEADLKYIRNCIGKGYTQAQMCRSFGISKGTMRKYLIGEAIPWDEYDRLQRLEEAKKLSEIDEGKCFADNGVNCSALEKKVCEGCAFFKTKAQNKAEEAAAKELFLQRIKAKEQPKPKPKKTPRHSLNAKPWLE